jgi:hypothetical protein
MPNDKRVEIATHIYHCEFWKLTAVTHRTTHCRVKSETFLTNTFLRRVIQVSSQYFVLSFLSRICSVRFSYQCTALT